MQQRDARARMIEQGGEKRQHDEAEPKRSIIAFEGHMHTERRDNGRFYTNLASVETLTQKEQRTLLSSVEGAQAMVYDVAAAIASLEGQRDHEAIVAKLRALPKGTYLLLLT
jgi:hypothetical protein